MSFQTGAIKLGSVDLNNSLQWTNRYAETLVAGNRKRTLAGGLVIFTQDLTRGRIITLTATVDTGWFTFGMVTQMQLLAASSGSSYVFEYHSEFYNVRFDYENTPVEFQPLVPKNAGYDNLTDYFIGTMRLVTV